MLIPLDGSNTAEKVLPYARLLARKLKLAVELMGAVDIADLAGQAPAERARFLDKLVEDGIRSTETYLKIVASTFSCESVICSIEKGRPAETIIDKGASERGTLIAMATHGRSGFNRWMLGSVAEKVLRGTTNPLLLVRPSERALSAGEASLDSILVPLDGSDLAASVLPSVTDLARKLDLEMILCRVFNVHYRMYAGADGYYGFDLERLVEDMRAEAQAYLEMQARELNRKGIDRISHVVREGLSADEIISLARRTPNGLIAMCTHGRSGVQRWVLGSVTETVVRHSGNPVLIVRES
jgi:nucleotide-binding universal stress UspA family protein